MSFWKQQVTEMVIREGEENVEKLFLEQSLTTSAVLSSMSAYLCYLQHLIFL